jgi:parallel beta-helix repeat protein
MTAVAVSLPKPAHADSSSPHAPIVIGSNDDFTFANGVTGGNGTFSNPYTIEGWSIYIPSSNQDGIQIHDTSAYFVIRNLYVYSDYYQITGIKMNNVANGALEHSQIKMYAPNLVIESSRNVLVSNNQLSWTMAIDSSQNIALSETSALQLITSSTDNLTIANSHFSAYQTGVSILDSTHVTIENNTMTGIALTEATSEQIDTITITTDNTVNGSPLVFYKDCSDLNLDPVAAGELIVVNCENIRVANFGTGTDNQPSLLELAFDTDTIEDHIATSILLTNSSRAQISNIQDQQISIDSSSNVEIFDSTARVTSGIGVTSSTNVSIHDNHHYAMGLVDSSNVTIFDNNLAAGCCTTDFTALRIDNSDHITISSNSFYSDWEIVGRDTSFLQISDNQFSFAAYSAIDLNSCSNVSITNNQLLTAGGGNGGVTLTACSNVDISGNNMGRGADLCCGHRIINPLTVSHSNTVRIEENNFTNTNTALAVEDSSDIIITGNNLQTNLRGVVLNDTMNVQVFHNNFLNNTVQAVDTYSNMNAWDDGYPSGGNFWSDFTGTDNCSGPNQDVCPSPDGIGDTPYVFNYNQDNYPLMDAYPIQ